MPFQIWSKTIRHGRFELDLIRQLHHVNTGHENGANVSAGISCILPLPQVVYTGDEAGRVVSPCSRYACPYRWGLLTIVPCFL